MKTKVIYTLVIAIFFLLTGSLQAQSHFVPAFTGNGTDHMNIKIVTATLSGLSLGVGDEIAVFDGAVCCGVVVLTQEIVKTNPASFGLIAASKADVGSNNGYTPGNSIQFKVWDQSASREYQVIRVVYFDPLTGLPTTVKPFTVNSTAFVSLQVNFKPTANAGPDQTVNEKEPVVLNGSQSSDPESDALTYTWTSLDGVQLQAANTANPTFTAPESTRDASYRFVLKTSDGLLESDPDTVVVSVIDVFNPTTHFQTVWTGNGTEHMNIYVVSALLDGIALEPDDEVAVFDGPLCVGAKKLIRTIDGQNNLQIVASLNTGDGLGYTPGDTILIRVYDHSANKETDIVQATYYNDNPTWLTSGRYAIGASSYISVEALTRVEQSLLLKAGWNMKSLMVTPDKANLFEVLQPLAETGNLRKVMDEKGQAIEHWGVFGGWQNEVGQWQATEGYKLFVDRDTTFAVSGPRLTMPMTIMLTPGWNIIAWPASTEQDASLVFQLLVQEGSLVKVMDEAGHSLEYWGEALGWINHIGQLKPGSAYHVNVNAASSLTVTDSYLRSAMSVVSNEPSTYFSPAYVGNGTDHMNLNVLDLAASGLLAGDEIGVFDANVCVGSVRLTNDNLTAGYLCLKASGNDSLFEWADGFTAGHPITLSLYRDQTQRPLKLTPLEGNETTFEPKGSLFGRLSIPTDLSQARVMSVTALPNPFKASVTLRIQHDGEEEVTVSLFDLSGKLVKQLFKGQVNGWHDVVWDGTGANQESLPAGVYVCKTNEHVMKLMKVE